MNEEDIIQVIETDRLYLLDRLQMIAGMFEEYVCEHEFAKKNDIVQDEAYEVLSKMADLYKTIVLGASGALGGEILSNEDTTD